MRIEVGTVKIDGARSTSLSWARFDYNKTSKTRGLKLLRHVILNNHVSCQLDVPWTHRGLVEEVARNSEKEIPIESLAPELSQNVYLRKRAIFGFPGRYIDQVARNYEDMYWWVSANGLNMAVIRDRAVLNFDAIAARLMEDARHRSKTGRIAHEEYVKIADALDEAKLDLSGHLERACQKALKNWNQKNSNRAIHTFRAALTSKLPWLGRGVKKRLYRAEQKGRWVTP